MINNRDVLDDLDVDSQFYDGNLNNSSQSNYYSIDEFNALCSDGNSTYIY